MNRVNKFLLIGASWLILVFAIYYFMLARPGITTRWNREATPPEQVSLLKLGFNGEILAQTQGGNLYQLFPGLNVTWESVNELAENFEPLLICNPDNADGYLILPPPGKVISRVREYCVATESGYHTEVVLLENGEIWSWRREVGGYLGSLLFLILCIAFALGVPFLLIGLGMKIRDWVQLKK